ncbi:phosphoribosylformylglycinamidine synthase subunit PurS [Chloroflexota bacterium]
MHRVEVRLKSHLPDARGLGLVKDIQDLGITSVSNVRVVDILWLDAHLPPEKLDLIGRHLLADPITQEYESFTLPAETGTSPWGQNTTQDISHSPHDIESKASLHVVEVAYNAGVTDPVEDTIVKALQDLNVSSVGAVRTVKRYLLYGQLDENELETICNRLLVNPIIQHVVHQFHFPANPQYNFQLKQIDISDEAGIQEVRQQFGFTDDELQAIVGYFQQQRRNPTDVEVETLAQTWLEHCIHKTFKGRIQLGEITIDNLLKSTIMKATQELNKPWCLSVFEDNAGVIDFDGQWALCFKVETHNHPSAVEPYGGAATGIGGVVRDPLGTGLGAKLILNTDVFCFAPPGYPYERLPRGVLHPRRIFKGSGLEWPTMATG